MPDRDKYGNYVNDEGVTIKITTDKKGNDHVSFYGDEVDKPHDAVHVNVNYDKEISNLIKNIKTSDYNIGFDLKGKMYSSVEFADKIDKILPQNSNITFIIGGSLGLNDEARSLCNELISFSQMTFPHGLFRGILLEQIYRACKINNHEMYHK